MKLKQLQDKAKTALKNGFDDKSRWEFEPPYGTPYIKVEIHSIIHEIIKELAELKDEESVDKQSTTQKN